MSRLLLLSAVFCLCLIGPPVRADVGDPQIRTDHPWYPGELACSTFDRLFATQAQLFERVVGFKPTTDEQKVLAAWLWRNTHYFHGEDGSEDLWGKGFTKGDLRTREYWTGLYAHGFGLCGTTHAQWSAEMNALLGHARGRCVGVSGHNSFEVFLTGGEYGKGRWALLDHDISTVVYDRDGKRLLSIDEIRNDWKNLTNRKSHPEKQHGWLVCGLHPEDGGVYSQYQVAEYLPGYSGPPPHIHLRRGETLRRYLAPGLEDGKTFAYWGRNYNSQGIPGPERARTWVNQPEKMFQSKTGTGYHPGQARYGNAVYTYRPDFTSSDYREGVIKEDNQHVMFEFYTPFIIAATPANSQPFGIYQAGCKNGLILHGQASCRVAVSVDQGKNWQDCGPFQNGMDLTDYVKGHRQYFLKLQSSAKELVKSGLTITTICQANPSVMPRLTDGGCRVNFASSRQAIVSAGPNLPQALPHVIAGKFGSPAVTLELTTPRGESAIELYAAAHVQSGGPPRADIKYQIEASLDAGKTWKPVVKDWRIERREGEPKDFWSQSLCYGSLALGEGADDHVQIRFRNDGRKNYLRCEAHLVYRTKGADSTKVTFAWTQADGKHQATHTFTETGKAAEWKVPTGKNTVTNWVEFSPVPKR